MLILEAIVNFKIVIKKENKIEELTNFFYTLDLGFI